MELYGEKDAPRGTKWQQAGVEEVMRRKWYLPAFFVQRQRPWPVELSLARRHREQVSISVEVWGIGSFCFSHCYNSCYRIIEVAIWAFPLGCRPASTALMGLAPQVRQAGHRRTARSPAPFPCSADGHSRGRSRWQGGRT